MYMPLLFLCRAILSPPQSASLLSNTSSLPYVSIGHECLHHHQKNRSPFDHKPGFGQWDGKGM